jgi:hypothetical protein
LARRRMIDPNIWASEDMAKLTIRQRLLVIGLFSNADDHGKGKAKPAYIRSTIFPYDDIPLHEIIDDLETIRAVISIEFYTVEGNSYYRFINWTKWQTVQKAQPSIIPDPVENDSGMSTDPFSPKRKEEKRKEEKIEEKGKELPAPFSELSNPHEIRITNFLKEHNVEMDKPYETNQFFSYIGVVDIEVMEAAIMKSHGKGIAYCLGTLKGMIKDRITKKEHLQQVKPGNVTQLRRGQAKQQIPIVKPDPAPRLSDEELERIRANARKLDERFNKKKAELG